MAKTNKFYAVRVGKKPGIYTSWDATKKQVAGYPNAKYKSFLTEAEAQQFMQIKGEPSVKQKTPKVKTDIVVFTDGGSRNHGNVAGGHVKATDPAAWAYLIDYQGKQHSDSAGEFGVTNNKMEITALVQALKWLADNGLNDKKIGVIADSRYVLNAIQKGWIKGWKKRGWKRSAGELKNAELWQQLDQLLDKFPQIQYAWTKGHATNKGNVFVDELLNQTMDQM
ncbi:ribonuclease H family protein [Fructilactobacillus frigidiflavus]|uniref:ribonuclease H family protein n=1 Tax=Fructilactobacillus frigidiflavus TaxID=3242688 RepID=UPI003756A2F1